MTAHVMVDLETLDTSPSAVILSIGAVAFKPETGVLANKSFYARLSMDSQMKNGRTISGDTLRWWMRQDRKAREEALGGNMGLKDALEGLKQYVVTAVKTYDAKIWANSPDFDCVILTNAYQMLGGSPPWKFWNTRCVRTMKDLAGIDKMEKLVPRQGLAHRAVDDAEYQANFVCEVYKRLNLSAGG